MLGEDYQTNEVARSRVLATEAVPGGGGEPAGNGLAAAAGCWSGRSWLVGGLLVLGTFIAYLPLWRAGFIWDDDTFLLQNPLIQQPDGLFRLWFTTAAPDYFPLTSTTLWLEWRLWGANPLGYHLVNILLHSLSAVGLWRVLARLRIPGAVLAAAIFAVHPVNVESVAWITELKNTLCMLFYLLSLLWYVRGDDLMPQPDATRNPQPATRFYALSLFAFALALLSKSAAAPLPVVLLGLTWWRRGRVGLRDVWRSVPYFALAAAAGLATLWFQTHRAIGASMIDVRNDSFWSRLAGAGWAVWFYLAKALLPLNLSFVYPRWRIDASSALAYVPELLLVAGLLVCWWYRRSWGRPLLLGLGYFVLLLLPILGFLNIYFMRYSLVADHWQYFAIIGPIALVAAGMARANTTSNIQHPTSNIQYPTANSQQPTANSSRMGNPWMLDVGCSPFLHVLLCSALVLGLGVLTWRQAGTYTDLETLWRATLARNPGAGLAHNNLGTLLLQRGRVDDAIVHFQKALVIEPNAADVHSNLGSALLGQGRVDAAAAQFREALRIQPDSALAHNNLGNALAQQGHQDEAIGHFQKAVEFQPGLASARYNLGGALLSAGRVDEAIDQLQKALELQPELAEARMNLGNALLAKGQVDEAIAHLRKAVALQPTLTAGHHNLGHALLQAAQLDEARAEFLKALALQPNFAGAHNGLGNTLLRKGRGNEAIAHFQRALAIEPRFAEAQLNLANVLLQAGQVDQAIAYFRKALDLQPNVAGAHNNLANALLGKGEVDEAVAHFQTALQLQPNLAEAHNGLANALRQKGRLAEAVTHYEAAVAALPDNPYLLNNLAWLLATCPEAAVRNGARAVELAQRAERLSGGKELSLLGTLAAAYAEAGRFTEAVAAAQRALDLAAAQANPAQAETLRARINLYQAGLPFHEPGLAPRGK